MVGLDLLLKKGGRCEPKKKGKYLGIDGGSKKRHVMPSFSRTESFSHPLTL